MRKISKLLVANRGEIALRVMRTARDLAIETVAVYSEADKDAPHTRFADASVCIGAGAVGQSYLVVEKIIEAAKQSHADAIHPGYGFLSENAAFAEAVTKAGLIFIGPHAEAIRLMGNKAEAKRRMIAAGVPCVPGYEGVEQSDDALLKAAGDIGFPLMVKAAAGGGGRGMRLVEDKKALESALATARSEAENAFGSGELILERAIIEPRHVEIQVFADTHGNAIHLGERDCSVQRRHQKVIEESPCPIMTPELRAAMGQAAVDAARDIDYCGAGTVEFLLDAEGAFYFLEMNTRLQVEHPVTEEVTGLDLVALQLRVAEGEALGIAQDDVRLRGHAIEVRLYAEDPSAGFLPNTGQLAIWREPSGAGLRMDSGVAEGQVISPFYDPMLAKLIAYGDTRETARTRLIRGLRELRLFGTRNNRDFLIEALSRESFATGAATTAFIAQEFGDAGYAPAPFDGEARAMLAVLLYLTDALRARGKSLHRVEELAGFSGAGALRTPYRIEFDDAGFMAWVSSSDGRVFEVALDDLTVSVQCLKADAPHYALQLGAAVYDAFAEAVGAEVHINLGARSVTCRNLLAALPVQADAGGGGRVLAPMHGRVVELFVEQGAMVKKGDRLAVLEAMKMQHEICAESDGKIVEIFANAGEQIGADELLIEIEVEGA